MIWFKTIYRDHAQKFQSNQVQWTLNRGGSEWANIKQRFDFVNLFDFTDQLRIVSDDVICNKILSTKSIWTNCQAQGQGQSQSQKSKLDPKVGSVMGWSTHHHPPPGNFFELETAN